MNIFTACSSDLISSATADNSNSLICVTELENNISLDINDVRTN